MTAKDTDDVGRLITPALYLLMVGLATMIILAGAPPTIEGIATGAARIVLFTLMMVPVTIVAMAVEKRLKVKNA